MEVPGGLLAAGAGLLAWAVFVRTTDNPSGADIMAATAPVRRKKRHFRSEATKPPFDIECELKEDGTAFAENETPDVITLQDINKMPTHSAYEFARLSQSDPERALRMLVGEDQWTRFWETEDWKNEPFDATNNLQQEAMEHYTGMTVGNS